MKRAVGQVPSPGQLAAGKLASGQLAAAGPIWLLYDFVCGRTWKGGDHGCGGFRMRMTFDSDDDVDDVVCLGLLICYSNGLYI